MALGIEFYPPIDSHHIGLFKGSNDRVGFKGASTFDGILQHVGTHIAGGGSISLRFDVPPLLISLEELHRPGRGVGWGITGIDHIGQGVLSLSLSRLPEAGLLRSRYNRAKGQGRHLQVVPLFEEDGGLRHVHPDKQYLSLFPFGLEQAHGEIGGPGGIDLRFSQDLPALTLHDLCNDAAPSSGMGHILNHDEKPVEAVVFLDKQKSGDDLSTDHPFRLAGDPE